MKRTIKVVLQKSANSDEVVGSEQQRAVAFRYDKFVGPSPRILSKNGPATTSSSSNVKIFQIPLKKTFSSSNSSPPSSAVFSSVGSTSSSSGGPTPDQLEHDYLKPSDRGHCASEALRKELKVERMKPGRKLRPLPLRVPKPETPPPTIKYVPPTKLVIRDSDSTLVPCTICNVDFNSTKNMRSGRGCQLSRNAICKHILGHYDRLSVEISEWKKLMSRERATCALCPPPRLSIMDVKSLLMHAVTEHPLNALDQIVSYGNFERQVDYCLRLLFGQFALKVKAELVLPRNVLRLLPAKWPLDSLSPTKSPLDDLLPIKGPKTRYRYCPPVPKKVVGTSGTGGISSNSFDESYYATVVKNIHGQSEPGRTPVGLTMDTAVGCSRAIEAVKVEPFEADHPPFSTIIRPSFAAPVATVNGAANCSDICSKRIKLEVEGSEMAVSAADLMAHSVFDGELTVGEIAVDVKKVFVNMNM